MNMNRTTAGLLAVLGSLALAGCSGDDDSGTTTECNITVVETFPANGETAAYYRTPIEVTFSAPDDTATMSVAGVTGTTSWRDNTLVLTPDTPLTPGTSYDVAIDYQCGAPTVSWTTSEVGGSADAAGLVGNAYVLNLADARFVQPSGVGPLLQQYLTVDILMGITEADASNILFTGAIGVEDATPAVQDTCQPTIDFPQAGFSDNPFFSAGPATTTIAVEGFEVVIDDLLIEGSVSPAGDYIAGAVLGGQIDTRPLVGLLDEEGGDEAICELASSIGVECEPCEDGGNFCLTLFVDSINAPGVDSSIEVIDDPCSRTECADDPDCADTGG
jgi:hypothetical protein